VKKAYGMNLFKNEAAREKRNNWLMSIACRHCGAEAGKACRETTEGPYFHQRRREDLENPPQES
jgi:hypothetical protein